MRIKKFVSIPEWSPVYTEPPHHFNGCTGLNVLCRAPAGVIEKLIPEPLKAQGDLFILRWQHMDECEGYRDVHFNEILFPCRWKDKIGVHCAIEYIDNEMGLIIGREVWGFPKKWGDFIWNETADGLHVECLRSGELLMRTEFTRSESPAVQWPDTRSYYLVKHIPPASRSGSPLIQVVRCDLTKKPFTPLRRARLTLSSLMGGGTRSSNSDPWKFSALASIPWTLCSITGKWLKPSRGSPGNR